METLPLEFEKLQINPSAYQVFQDGKEILLTKSEFELLLYLAQCSGMVRTREQIRRIQSISRQFPEWDIGLRESAGDFDKRKDCHA